MMAETLRAVGTRRAFVVAGSDGMDEITISGPTRLSAGTSAGVEPRDVQPEEFGVPRATVEHLRGGDAATNARLLMSVLDGERSPIATWCWRTLAAAFTLAGKAGDFHKGARLAAEVLESGAARAKLQALVAFTQRHRR